MHTFCGVTATVAVHTSHMNEARSPLAMQQDNCCHMQALPAVLNGIYGTGSQGTASLPKTKDIYSVGLGYSLGAILNQTLPYQKSEPSCSSTKFTHLYLATGCPCGSLPASVEAVSFLV